MNRLAKWAAAVILIGVITSCGDDGNKTDASSGSGGGAVATTTSRPTPEAAGEAVIADMGTSGQKVGYDPAKLGALVRTYCADASAAGPTAAKKSLQDNLVSYMAGSPDFVPSGDMGMDRERAKLEAQLMASDIAQASDAKVC